jgi:hypothetical protein
MNIPEEFRDYDPFYEPHSEGILKHFKVKVSLEEEDNGDKTWGYLWEYGGVTLGWEKQLTEKQARAAAGLAVYLYACGVHPGLDDRLALVYILRGGE